MSEKMCCPICGTENEHKKELDIEDYFCDTCGYFKCSAYGEGGHGIGFDLVKFNWLAVCKEAWERYSTFKKKGGEHEESD